MLRAGRFVLLLLFIELLDEFVFGAREAAWPLIRTGLGLSYAQIGLLLSLPGIFSGVAEPILGIMGDVGNRRTLILGGGVAFAVALAIAAQSGSFVLLLISFLLLYPASGAFVSLSQATLMDVAPERREHNMARWTLAGSIGVVIGPLALSGTATLGFSWRELFLCLAGLALVVVVASSRSKFPTDHSARQSTSLRAGFAGALRALRRREVLRWLALLQFSNLMLDILLGFLALYFVDVVGTTPAEAGLAVAVWSGMGLLGGALLIPLLERVHGLRYLRWSAAVELLLFPALLLAPVTWLKVLLGGLLGLFNAGWYSIPMAQLYGAMPGRSGTVMTVGNLFGLVGQLIPLGLGLVAQQVGLSAAMWLLLLGPITLLVGLPGFRSMEGRAISG